MLDPTRTLRVLAALAVAMSLLALAACGGDDDSSDEPVTKADYIEQGDAICQELYKQRDPLETEAARAALDGDTEGAAQTFENAAEITDNRVAELRELTPPEGDEAAVDEIWTRGEEVADTARTAADAIRTEDQKSLAKASAQGRIATTRFNKAAIDYGFFSCGRGVTATIG